MTLPQIPNVNPALVAQIQALGLDQPDVPDTTEAEVRAAREAWKAAHEAIMAAWRITPSAMLNTRTTITRGAPNQLIASSTAIAMMNNASNALDAIARNQYARERGWDWAVATDAEAVRRQFDDNK